jgi:antitoxin YefM
MIELSVNKFRANLKDFVDKAIEEHLPIRVNRRTGKDFIIVSAEDWERDQEILYVLRNKSLMRQVAESLQTYSSGSGYQPNPKQIDEINRF